MARHQRNRVLSTSFNVYYVVLIIAIICNITLNGCYSTAGAFTPTSARVSLGGIDNRATSSGVVQLRDAVISPHSLLRRNTQHIGPRKHLGLKFNSKRLSHEIFFQNLDAIYTEASTTIRCPFIKRRIADTIDNVAMIMRFLIIRHKSLWASPPDNLFHTNNSNSYSNGNSLDIDHHDSMQVPGCKAVGRYIQIDHMGRSVKTKNLPLETIQNIIIQDWSIHNDKGYYVTGKLNSTIYRDDCLFDGPDPDMPVKGLRKYLGAASHLFDSSKSFAKLLDVNIVQVDAQHSIKQKSRQHDVIEVKWRMEGVLMLPWRPKVKPWSGWTRYYLDHDNLIVHHQEGWDISVMEAFVGTMFPTLADKIWKTKDMN